MNDLEQRAMNMLSAVVRADDHPTCWFCKRGKAIGAHHHFGDRCMSDDVAASPSWRSEQVAS